MALLVSADIRMIQLKVLTGKKAGNSQLARRFPVRIGRAKSSDLQLEEPGVWDEHLTIKMDPADGFVLEARPEASTSVNGQLVQRSILRNGDVIEFGSQKLQFWIGEMRQRGLGTWEWLAWITLAATCAGQIVLICRLLP